MFECISQSEERLVKRREGSGRPTELVETMLTSSGSMLFEVCQNSFALAPSFSGFLQKTFELLVIAVSPSDNRKPFGEIYEFCDGFLVTLSEVHAPLAIQAVTHANKYPTIR